MERYRPPRRPGISASTLKGAHGPGSSLPAPRKRFHRAFDTYGPSGEVLLPCDRTRRIPNLPSQAHPGLTCLGTGETVSPTRTLLTLQPTTRTVPDPAPVRADDQYGAEGYQTDTGSKPHLRRYLRRQVSISCCSLMHGRKHPEMGPCLRRGLRGEERSLSHKPYPRRMPGSLAETTRSQPREIPASAGESGRGNRLSSRVIPDAQRLGTHL